MSTTTTKRPLAATSICTEVYDDLLTQHAIRRRRARLTELPSGGLASSDVNALEDLAFTLRKLARLVESQARRLHDR